jgi:pimeloyl-ACP methyl ester carboxylesterase
VNLSAYNSAASALDVRDVMTALGYRRWNLYGLSYGTRLALTAMRDAAQGIRSVILDSTLPIQADFPATFARDFERSLDAVFDLCERDPACRRAYPALASVFFDLVAQLEEVPLMLERTDPDTGERHPLVLTGSRFLFGVQQALYRPELIGLLPLAIRELAAGNGALVGQAAALLLDRLDAVSWGTQMSVFCAEEIPFVTAEVLRDAEQDVRPELLPAGAYVTGLALETCAFWGSDLPSSVEDAAVTSDIPTLVLAGELDPITPPAYGRQAAETLLRSQFFEFEGFAHAVIAPNPAERATPRCAMQLVRAFLENPVLPLDAGCIADLPALHFAGT